MASDRKPIRFRLANDWISGRLQMSFINRYPLLHFVVDSAKPRMPKELINKYLI
jgi:hypothetical protein